ncbi:GNAT family N-acetyltransferase [bacterium]|nr:GNAT family N-acetyltransferase [bacterium]
MPAQINGPKLEPLEWDSNFFGFGVGRLTAAGVNEVREGILEAQKNRLRLLYWAIPSTAEVAINSRLTVQRYVGDQLTHTLQPLAAEKLRDSDNFTVTTHANKNATPELIELAVGAGWKSRFNIDPDIPHQNFVELYTTWIQNSCSGAFADKVYTAFNEQSKLMGFITVKKRKNRATVGLLAVSSEHRRQGVGRSLIQRAKCFALQQGCASLSVGTQATNTGANTLYSKEGFVVERSESWFHLWVSKTT